MKRCLFVILLLVVFALSPSALGGGDSPCPGAFCGEAAVCVTKNGKRYHTASCRTIKDSEVEKMSRAEAEKRGYKPCKVCHP